MKKADLANFLRTVPMFTDFSESTYERLAADSRVRSVPKGDYIFFQGDVANRMFVVLNGWIVIILTSSDGRELAISEVRPGYVFGENAILTGARRSATAVARENTELIEISSGAFLATLEGEPRLTRRLLDTAVARQDEGNERERALAFLHAGARVVRVLRTLDEMDRLTADKGYVTVSQDELALRTGLTRQTVARFLGRWRRRGWLLTGRGRIMLLNREMLFALEDDAPE